MLAASARFLAIPWESRGGGAFAVLKAGGKGRVGPTAPLFIGHKAPVIDVAFNPFNDFVVASASDDAAIKLWQVTESGGQVQGTKEPYGSLTGHARKAGRVVFNPLVDSALASFGGENAVKLWDISKGSVVSTIKSITQPPLDINWSQDGNLLVLPAKDKRLHVLDVRAGNEAWSSPNHPGQKGSRAVFYDKLNYVFTSGYSQSSARQVAVRDTRNPERPLSEDDIDFNSGVLITFIDADAGVVYLFGRGDTSTRYYELREQAPQLLSLSQYALSEPIRAAAHAPKYAVSTDACELDRFYVITQSKAIVLLQMIVPRRNAEGIFQEDLYPDTVGPDASIDFDSWKAGQDAVPKTISLQGGVQLSEARGVEAIIGDDPEALRAEIARLQARVAELEEQLAAK
jgi:hypothetical protein